MCPALSGDRDDVAAAVCLVCDPLGQLLASELVDRRRDVAAVQPGAAAQARLAGRPVLLQRGQQPEVVTARTRGSQALGQQPMGMGGDLADQPSRLSPQQSGRRIVGHCHAGKLSHLLAVPTNANVGHTNVSTSLDQPATVAGAAMPEYPPLSTQVIGQTESALGALLEPPLAETATTFQQWLVLTVTAANGAGIERGQLVTRICDARKVGRATVEAAIAELTAGGLVTADGLVALTEAGRARYQRIRGALEEITAQL